MENNTKLQPTVTEDEIDLRELFQTIWKYKYKIALFTFIITLLTVLYTLSKPNEYKVTAVLTSTSESKDPALGSLGGLAAIAGVNMGSAGGEFGPLEAFTEMLNDFTFMKTFMQKNKLCEKALMPNFDNYYFALGYRGIFDLFNGGDGEEIDFHSENSLFDCYKLANQSITIEQDKNTNLITASVSGADMNLSYSVLQAFLIESSKYLIAHDLREIDRKLDYYRMAMAKIEDIQLKAAMSTTISGLINSKITLQSSPYYKLNMLIPPELPYFKDKVGPKRGLIVMVAFVTSIILCIFCVFLYDFIRNNKLKD